LWRRVQIASDLFASSADEATRKEHVQQALGEIHTLKGEASMLGLIVLATLAHSVEELLATGGAERLPIAARALAVVRDALERQRADACDALLQAVLDELSAIAGNSGVTASPSRVSNIADGAYDANDSARAAQRWAERDTESLDASRDEPLEPMLRELAQHARAMAERQGKRLEVVVSPGGVEIERGSAAELWDSLLHLVQNAVDHGIEPVSERGSKPALARLALSAELLGSGVILRVEDDGRGIDLEQVRRSAVARGVLLATGTGAAGDQQMYALLFEHGFSTLDEAGPTSGRGVGLDVVRRRIAALGGTVEISTVLGRGTRFSLLLPAFSPDMS
jgi:chemotaxis protein histidine kinase CheA